MLSHGESSLLLFTAFSQVERVEVLREICVGQLETILKLILTSMNELGSHLVTTMMMISVGVEGHSSPWMMTSTQ